MEVAPRQWGPGRGTSPRWSVVIPAYNEGKRLPAYLREITEYFDGRGEKYEVVVVDDGSQDGTEAVVKSLRDACPALQLVQLPCHRGKGCAVRTGMLEAVGELRLFADADGATPIREVERLEAQIAQGADLAIGSRALRDNTRTIQAKWHRVFFGQIFNAIVRCLRVGGIADTQCGFKLFRAQVAMDLFSVLQIDGYGFDVELLFVAQRRGYGIAEVPINWADQAGGKVRVAYDGLHMLHEVWAIRRNELRGLYAPREVALPLSTRSASHARFSGVTRSEGNPPFLGPQSDGNHPSRRHLSLAFWTILILGALLRLYHLDLRPPHHDEGIHGWLVEEVFGRGFYRYNPERFHGPFHHYAITLAELFFGRSLFALRLPTALMGALTPLLLWPLRRHLGAEGVLCSMLFLAVSPSLVYYSRDAIPETHLVFFTLAAVVSLFVFLDTKQLRPLHYCAASLACLLTVKETAYFFLLLLGLYGCMRYQPWTRRKPTPRRTGQPATLVGYLGAMVVFVLIYVVVFSGFFREPEGIYRSLTAVRFWVKTGTKEHGHFKPFAYSRVLPIHAASGSSKSFIQVPFGFFR